MVRGGSVFLVTNYHVLATRSPVDGANLHPAGAWPDEVAIVHNVEGKIGTWQPIASRCETLAVPYGCNIRFTVAAST